MNSTCLEFPSPIGDAISRIRFAPRSNNLLISSWDSNLRLYDVDSSELRLEAPSHSALLDCCFQDDSVAFAAASDGFIRRYHLLSGDIDKIGSHDDIANCIGYSDETCQVITAGFDKRVLLWDTRVKKAISCMRYVVSEVEDMSLLGLNVTVSIGATVLIYDLRYLDKPVQSNNPLKDIHIKCVSSVPYSKGFAVGSVDGRVALEVDHSMNSDDLRYIFRCHPTSKEGRHHLASVNEIAFNPLVCGAFVTGDNEGYVVSWDARSRRRLFEFSRFPNSVSSLSYNHEGELLAVASSHTYQEAKEMEEHPQIFVHQVDDMSHRRSVSAIGSSTSR